MTRRLLLFALFVCLSTSAVFATTHTWTGAAGANWSNPSNWSPASAPSAGDDLVFPNGAPNHSMNNDLPAGTSVGAMSVADSCSLSGNALTMMGNLSFDPNYYGESFTFNVAVTLGAPVTITVPVSKNGDARFNGPLDVNGQTLTLSDYTTTYINGPLTGSGSILGTSVGGGWLYISGGGNFSGTIHGMLRGFNGNLPNANVTAVATDAVGTLGDLTMWSNPLDQPTSPIDTGYLSITDNAAGVLHTKALWIKRLLKIELYPASSSDQVQVTGTVKLDAMLDVQIGAGTPSPGQSFVIIDNDGTDPVNGTFIGLPEGATLNVGGYSLQITYTGGDGNDVVLSSGTPNKLWTGAFSGAWSDGRNWSPQGVPQPAQALIFPKNASNRTMTNDLPAGTAVGTLSFVDAYILGGNPLTLMGDLTFGPDDQNYGSVIFNANVKLGAPVLISELSDHSFARFAGSLDINGQTLTFSDRATTYITGPLLGSGSIVGNSTGGGPLEITGGGSFSGSIRATLRFFNGSLPDATVTAWSLDAVGTVGSLTMWSNPLDLPVSPIDTGRLDIAGLSAGVLHTRSLWIKRLLDIDLYPAASSDQLQVIGTVTLNCMLGAAIRSGTPSPGQSFVIIDNDGTDPVAGTFAGLPEGTTFDISGASFRITYAGGDGNDVVLMAVAQTTTVLTQTMTASTFGQQVALTATAVSSGGTPTGTAMFTADGASLGSAPLQNGVATLTVSGVQPGAHSVMATLHGTGAFADSTSNVGSLAVARGHSAAAVVSSRPHSVYGQTVRFTASVSPLAPAAGEATGNVTFLADGAPLGSAPLAAGTAVFDTAFHPGVKSITAAYAGDAHFESSSAAAIEQTVGKAPTAVDARTGSELFAGLPTLFTVAVNVENGAGLSPAGDVSVSEGGTMLVERSLVNGAARITLAPRALGVHEFVVSYGGTADFASSSVTIRQTVINPLLSVHGARIVEGDHVVTTVSVAVSLAAPSAAPVSVSFATLAGTATEGVDYEAASGVIEFAPGEQTKAIELHIIGDLVAEQDETFSVLLSSPVNAALDAGSALVIIANDDALPPRHRPARH